MTKMDIVTSALTAQGNHVKEDDIKETVLPVLKIKFW